MKRAILTALYSALTFPSNLWTAHKLRRNGWTPAKQGKWQKRIAYGQESYTVRYYPSAAIEEIEKEEKATRWNPGNKVVQDHRTGRVNHSRTNRERKKRGLPTPWNPLMAADEIKGRPVK